MADLARLSASRLGPSCKVRGPETPGPPPGCRFEAPIGGGLSPPAGVRPCGGEQVKPLAEKRLKRWCSRCWMGGRVPCHEVAPGGPRARVAGLVPALLAWGAVSPLNRSPARSANPSNVRCPGSVASRLLAVRDCMRSSKTAISPRPGITLHRGLAARRAIYGTRFSLEK